MGGKIKMEYRRFKDKYVVRLQKGEELIESILKLAREEGISLGRVSGLAAVDKVEISLYAVETKEYLIKELTGDMEIVSLEGNIAEKDGQAYLHLHGSVAHEENRVYGGHMHLARVSVTAELIVDVIDGKVDRQFDEETGANLWKFN